MVPFWAKIVVEFESNVSSNKAVEGVDSMLQICSLNTPFYRDLRILSFNFVGRTRL
jgi:hypothetical protein